MVSSNEFWYFYRKIIDDIGFDTKILIVTMPFNYDGFVEMGIKYNPSILDTKVSDFLTETGNVSFIDNFYDPYLARDLFRDYRHLTEEGRKYLAQLIINKIKENKW